MGLASFICLSFCITQCGTQGTGGQIPPQLKCDYIGMTRHDSSAQSFTWQPLKKVSENKGPVTFQWKTDSTLSIYYTPKIAAPPSDFIKVEIQDRDRKKIPISLLNNKFKLIGVYEAVQYRNSDFYFVIYVHDKQVLVQIWQTFNFLFEVIYYSDKNENAFQQAGYSFPFKPSTRF